MNFTSKQSNSWETDEFQDNFIRDYFGNQSMVKSHGKYAERNINNKRKSLTPTEESPFKRQKTNDSFDSVHSTNSKIAPINERLRKLANSKSDLKSTKKKNSVNNSKKRREELNMPQNTTKPLKVIKKLLSPTFSTVKDMNMRKHDNESSQISYYDCKSPTLSMDSSNDSETPENNYKKQNKNIGTNVFSRMSKKLSGNFTSPKGEDEYIISKNKFSSNTKDKSISLRIKAIANMQAAKFRLLNEKLYTVNSSEAFSYFHRDKDAFKDYHHGYQEQVRKWLINPVDLIIQDLRTRSKDLVVADLGCGDAKIARTFPEQKIYSFDLISLNDHVTACDMSKLPLPNASVDIVVFCLSLMGINLKDFILQAFRILKQGGLLMIAEVESRIDNLKAFIESIEAFGFSLANKDESHKMFVLLNFNKVKKKAKTSGPEIKMNPCFYKKR